VTPTRILTFPCAEIFMTQLARLGCSIEVAVATGTVANQPWMLARALPPDIRPVPWTAARARRVTADYDVVICHTLDELAGVRAAAAAMPAVLRPNPPREAMFGLGADQAFRLLGSDGSTTSCVFDSVAHRRAWSRIDGVVIAPGVNISAFGPYAGDEPSVLIAGHLLAELPLQSGYPALERITAGLPVVALGFNPSLGQSRLVSPRLDRLAAYRRHRLYLNTAVSPFADAANPWVLEAMASGMPVVTLADAASPVEHGVTGLVADEPAGARLHVMELLEDHDLAMRLGRAARESIDRRYPPERFLSAWSARIDAIMRGGHRSPAPPALTRISA